MTSYKWTSTLCRTASARDAAIAYDWMTAGGNNSSRTIDEFIAEGMTPEAAANEAIDCWNLLDVYDENGSDYRGSREGQPVYPELTRETLVEAFRAFFKKRPDRTDDEDAA